MGHVGLTPQTATALGGYRAQGRTAERAPRRCMQDALALQEAGCFAIVFEAIPAEVTDLVMAHMEIAGDRHRRRPVDGRPGARPARPARRPRRPRRRSSSPVRRRPRRDGARRRARTRTPCATRASRRPEHTLLASPPEELERLRARLPRRHAPRTTGEAPRRAATFTVPAVRSATLARRWRACPSCSLPREREFFDLFEEAGANIVRAAEMLERDARVVAREVRARARDPALPSRRATGSRTTSSSGSTRRSSRRSTARTSSRSPPALDDIVDFTEEVADFLGLYRIEAPMDQAHGAGEGAARRPPPDRRGAAAAAHASGHLATTSSRSTASRTTATARARGAGVAVRARASTRWW